MTTTRDDKSTRRTYLSIGDVTDFPIGRGKRVEVDGKGVAIFRLGDEEFYALRDRCTHADARLSGGRIDGTSVACPRHGAQFDLKTGSVLTLQAVRNVETYAVTVEDGKLFIDLAPTLAEPMWKTGRRLDQALAAHDPRAADGNA